MTSRDVQPTVVFGTRTLAVFLPTMASCRCVVFVASGARLKQVWSFAAAPAHERVSVVNDAEPLVISMVVTFASGAV